MSSLGFTFTMMKMDLRWMIYQTFSSSKFSHLSKDELAILKELFKNGIAVIPNYWSREDCDDVRGALHQHVNDFKSKDLDSGAYVRAKLNNGDTEDQGVVRIYHVDKESAKAASFMNDESVQRIVDAYKGMKMHKQFSAFQYNASDKGGTRGYHVDSFIPEFKSFLYLDDVTEESGPFTYLLGSHKAFSIRYKRMIQDNGRESNTGFSEEECQSFIKQKQLMLADKGTMILCDINGLHRGSPQLGKTRSVLYTAFMFTTDEESRNPER